MTERTRIARIRRGIAGPSESTVVAYLPGNYRVTDIDDEYIYIAGEDRAGWTLDDYVIPRLASGLYHAEEL